MFDKKNVKNWNGQNGVLSESFEGQEFEISNFMEKYDDFEVLKKEMFYLETDGRFEKRMENMMEKEEKHLWLSFGQMSKEAFPG